jgi:hypothetical protein
MGNGLAANGRKILRDKKGGDLSTRNKLIAVAAEKTRKKQIHPSAQTK